MRKQVIVSSLLRIMHYPCFHYYIVITHYYYYYPILHVTNWACLDSQPEQFENDNLNSPHTKSVPVARSLHTTSDVPFFFGRSIWTYGSVVNVSSLKSCDLGSILAGFCVALSPSVHWHALFYFAAMIIFLGFRQWQSRADRVWTLNTNIQLWLFSGTWRMARRPWGRTRPHVPAWRMGVILAIVNPRSKSDKRCFGLCFSLNSKLLENKGPLWGFFNHKFVRVCLQILQFCMPVVNFFNQKIYARTIKIISTVNSFQCVIMASWVLCSLPWPSMVSWVLCVFRFGIRWQPGGTLALIICLRAASRWSWIKVWTVKASHGLC